MNIKKIVSIAALAFSLVSVSAFAQQQQRDFNRGGGNSGSGNGGGRPDRNDGPGRPGGGDNNGGGNNGGGFNGGGRGGNNGPGGNLPQPAPQPPRPVQPAPQPQPQPQPQPAQMFPFDGPQAFNNSVENSAYSWTFSGVDANGCRSCMAYNSGMQCNPQNVGQKMKVGQPGTRDNDYVYTCQAGFGGNFPADGPHDFANSGGRTFFQWRYKMTDNNGCNSCQIYNPQIQCNRQTVGQTMKVRQPGTRDNDYVYECAAAN